MTDTDQMDESAARKKADREARRVTLILPRGWPFLLAVILMAPCAILGWRLSTRSAAVEDSTAPAHRAAPSPHELGIPCRPGPWGDIFYDPFMLTPPAELIDYMNPEFGGNDWYFPQTTESELQNFFRKVDLDDAVRQRLLKSARPAPNIGGFVVRRDVQLVRQLSPKARMQIYSRLSIFDANVDQASAFRFAGESLEEWLGDSGLPKTTIESIKPLLYRNRSFQYFADLPLILSPSAKPAERLQVVRALSRKRSLLLRLHVGPDADVDSLVAYWGSGGRERHVRPLIEGLARLSDGGEMEIIHLLPPLVRARLHTFPKPLFDDLSKERDCHWTSFNFFNDPPDDQCTNTAYAMQLLRTRFEIVEGDPQLGDVLVFLDGQDGWFHSAVYLAADVVFTKNGARTSSPWMLMHLSDMKRFYFYPSPITVKIFRHAEE